MNVNDVYVSALALLGEKRSDCQALEGFVIPYVNRIIIDSFRHNNSILSSKGEEILLHAPFISQMDDEIMYDEMLVLDCFPYGLAAYCCTDDDREKYNLMNYEYSVRLESYLKAEETDLGGNK